MQEHSVTWGGTIRNGEAQSAIGGQGQKSGSIERNVCTAEMAVGMVRD